MEGGSTHVQRFPPRQLTLFKINAYGDNDEERTKALEKELRRIPSNSDTPLDAFERIFNVFPGTPEKTYHILVVVPQGEHSTHGRGHCRRRRCSLRPYGYTALS